MFWIKPSVINVDCFTSNPMVHEHFRIDRASKFFPDEIKLLPNYVEIRANHDPNSNLKERIGTLRKCNGLIDLFSVGMIIPCWSDITLEATDLGHVHYIDRIGRADDNWLTIQPHERMQFGSGIYPNHASLKLIPPWYVEEKSGVKFTWNMCDWHRTDIASKVRVVSGIIDFKHQHQVNINMFMEKNSIIKFEAGDPLVHLIPMSDKKIKLHHHLIDKDIFLEKFRKTMIETQYKNHRKLRDESEAKCPFGFGK